MASERLVLGVDGGQTHTEAVLGYSTGRILARGHSGPSNHIQEPGGPERFRTAMRVCVDEALSHVGLRRREVEFAAAHFGLSGGPALREPILRELMSIENLSVAEDTSNALWSVTGGADGLIVIAGTGSNAFGRKGKKTWRVGGWGYVLGDEGSAYHIGLQALKHVLRASEGRDRWGWLANEIMKRAKAPTVRALHDAVYAGTLDKVQVAQLAKLVDEGVQKDRRCRLLLHRAADDLFEIAERVILKLKLGSDICGYVGKVFESATVLRRFIRHLKQEFPSLKVKAPNVSQSEAAFRIALALLRH